jgi:hypothetical protein
MVKKTINALVCVLIAPLAFAQTRPTNTGQKTTSTTNSKDGNCFRHSRQD